MTPDEMPALNESPENALAREREARQAEDRYFAVLHDSLGTGEYGIQRWLKAHPQAIGEYLFAGPECAALARNFTTFIMHLKAIDYPDFDMWRDFAIQGIVEGVKFSDADALARKLARLWEVNGA